MEIPYYEEPPSYEAFLQDHLRPNLPALIGPALTQEWRARREWVERREEWKENEPTMQPRFEFLKAKFGSAEAHVAECDQREFTDQRRVVMGFRDFVTRWQRGDARLYLKDWHFCNAFPDYDAYQVPEIFAGNSAGLCG